MSYNTNKKGAAEYQQYMQLTAEQKATLAEFEEKESTNPDPKKHKFAELAYLIPLP